MGRKSQKPTTSKSGTSQEAFVKTSINFEAEVHKLLRFASVETGLEMSEIVNTLVKEKFGGWHIRRGRGAKAESAVLAAVNSQNDMDDDAVPLLDDPNEPLTPGGVMSTLPLPVPGPSFMKRSKVITDSYVRHSAPRDAAIDALASEN